MKENRVNSLEASVRTHLLKMFLLVSFHGPNILRKTRPQNTNKPQWLTDARIAPRSCYPKNRIPIASPRTLIHSKATGIGGGTSRRRQNSPGKTAIATRRILPVGGVNRFNHPSVRVACRLGQVSNVHMTSLPNTQAHRM